MTQLDLLNQPPCGPRGAAFVPVCLDPRCRAGVRGAVKWDLRTECRPTGKRAPALKPAAPRYYNVACSWCGVACNWRRCDEYTAAHYHPNPWDQSKVGPRHPSVVAMDAERNELDGLWPEDRESWEAERPAVVATRTPVAVVGDPYGELTADSENDFGCHGSAWLNNEGNPQ